MTRDQALGQELSEKPCWQVRTRRFYDWHNCNPIKATCYFKNRGMKVRRVLV